MSDEEDIYQVYAIKHQYHSQAPEREPGSDGVWRIIGWEEPKTVAVSAESEYGAIKRFCGNFNARIIDVVLIPDRKPQYDDRRVEGFTEFDWTTVRDVDDEGNIEHLWEYS